jgi:hypothetical protein
MQKNHLSDSEALAFLESLFPGGVKDPALIGELCPEGWKKSALFACYHPSPEVIYQEHLRFSRNLKSLFARSKAKPGAASPSEDEPEPTYEEFLAKHPPDKKPISPEAMVNEPAELLGLCLWDVFSDNHDVIAADGRIVHLGSFRGSAGVISDFIEGSSRVDPDEDGWWDSRGSGYLDFYMGTSWIAKRADLSPAYHLIFRRLNNHGADWAYAFPRIYAIDFGVAHTQVEGYDPSAALAREQEARRFRKSLDEDVLAAKREARAKEPPTTVRAYQEIFRRFPKGWPPDPYSSD